jgi:CDP-diacylglycerol--glycerol-3-phosphate 3-phosphatidyltransferase
MSESDIRSGTLHLSDEAFVRAFESCELTGSAFHHADHVRLTWIYVRQFGEQAAKERVLAGILRFATHSGSAKKFHYTQTCAWVRLIAAAQLKSEDVKIFLEFVAAHPELLDAQALARYYSKSLLESPAARAGWIEPDVSALPLLSK